jgi:hydroxyacylglutathione hydrolase
MMPETPANPTSPINIQVFELGPFQTNVYILWPKDHRPDADCWIIDASFDADQVVRFLREHALKPTRLLLTHAHVDHIAGIPALRAAFPGLPIAMHKAEGDWLSDAKLNLSGLSGMAITAGGARADTWLNDGETLTFRLGSGVPGVEVRVLHTPGHSPGGLTFYSESLGQALVGDTLFAGSIGRADFPGSDFETLASSIRTKLYTLPPTTVIWPGHGPSSTIGHERVSNPFVRG